MSDRKPLFSFLFGSAVILLSVFLILVVGYAQALKSYQQQINEAVAAQAGAAKIGLEQILGSGVPIYDIANLDSILQPIVAVNDAVTNIRIVADEQSLYQYNDQRVGTYLNIPLNNKFSQVGELEVVINNGVIKQAVIERFFPLAVGCLLVSVFLGASMFRNSNSSRYLTRFSVLFGGCTFAVILVVVSLYITGLDGKAVAIANILGQRMAPIISGEIDPQYVSGLDSLLDTYRVANPEVSGIALMQNGHSVALSGQSSLMASMTDLAGYRYSVGEESYIDVEYDSAALLSQLAQTMKSFVILFIGCAFICFVFARVIHTPENSTRSEVVLDRLKPLFLLAVFMESLMIPVLPPYLASVVASGSDSMALSSYLYTAYFVGFAITLLPASRVIQLMDIRRVLNLGIVLSIVGCLVLAFSSSVIAVLLARLLSGVGQAVVFIAVQGYILRFSNQSNKTQAAGIIVFCFNAAFISGASIGALLVDYIGESGIFLLSATSGIVVLLLATLLPAMKPVQVAAGNFLNQLGETAVNCVQLLKQGEFLRSMVFVGIPTKMMLTGVVTYAVPIILAGQQVPKESIGQVLMVYAGAVLITSRKASLSADNSQNYRRALVIGTALSIVALLVLGIAQMFQSSFWMVNTAMLSMLTLGVSHGFINAPIISHVVSLSQAESESTIASTYRFLERFGHVLGALVVAALFQIFGQSMAFYLMAGFFVLSLLVVLFVRGKGKPAQEVKA